MEPVFRDMLYAIVIVNLKTILTQTCGIVKAQDNAFRSLYNAMGPALMTEQNAETTCASAVRMILTVSTAATTSEIATAPASGIMNHAMVPVSRDIIFAMIIAFLTSVFKQNTGIVKAQDNALGRRNNAMEPVSRDIIFAMRGA